MPMQFFPLEQMLMLVNHPWIALVVAGVFLTAYVIARRTGAHRRLILALLAGSAIWAGYWAYEQFHIGFGPGDNIRVDLLFLPQILFTCSAICAILGLVGFMFRDRNKV